MLCASGFRPREGFKPGPGGAGGCGRWGPGVARWVGRLAAGAATETGGWRRYSVPGRVAHGVGIRGAQVGHFRNDHQRQQVFGDVIPIEGALHGGGNAVEICHGFFLC